MVSKKKVLKKNILSFQDTILNLQKYWSKQGCVILQPYDLEVGAGTFHPATTLRSLGAEPWRLLMFNHPDDLQMVDMVTIQIDSSIIINFRF